MPAQDELNQRIGVLTRRETEARILAPLLDALGEEFGRERVLNVLRETIIKIRAGAGRGDGAADGQRRHAGLRRHAARLAAGRRAAHRDAAPGRQRLPLQRHALPLRRDVSRPGHPGAGRACSPATGTSRSSRASTRMCNWSVRRPLCRAQVTATFVMRCQRRMRAGTVKLPVVPASLELRRPFSATPAW